MGTRIIPGAGFGLPFPFPLAIGTDICQISRIARILRGPRGERFVKRILAPDEHRLLEVTSITTDVHLRRYLSEDPKAEKMWWARGNMEQGFGLSAHLGAIDREMAEEEQEKALMAAMGGWQSKPPARPGDWDEKQQDGQTAAVVDVWPAIEAALRSHRDEDVVGPRSGGPLHVGGERWQVENEIMGPDEMASREMRKAWTPNSAHGNDAPASLPPRAKDYRTVDPDAATAWEISMMEKASLTLRRASTFMAGRFAAKEAVIKAHRLRLGFQDIIIHREVSVPRQQRNTKEPGKIFLKGAPIACVRTPDGRGQQHLVSISHDGDYSTATALVYVPEMQARPDETEVKLDEVEVKPDNVEAEQAKAGEVEKAKGVNEMVE